MEIQTRSEGTFKILAPIGEIDFHVSPTLRQRILSALDDGANLLVDMSGVEYIDSSGIACLVEGLQHARGRGLEFGLAAVRDSALQVLKLTRLDTVFPIHESVDARLGIDRSMPADAGSIIEIRDLVVHYGERQILDRVSLEIHRGEVMVIMGGSGSGKSTLLRCLLGLKRPSSGQVSILGTDLTRLKGDALLAFRKQMGVAFQGGALLSSLSVAENVQLPLRHHTRLDESTIQIMTRLKLELVNLAGFEGLMPAELSGGMVKRAAFARAVIMDPKLLFFDEPSAGLDPVTSAELDELILRLRDTTQTTIVVVTHELESAFKIADRIAVLGEGRMLMQGSVAEVRASEDQRIQDMLNRRPRDEQVDPDAYLRRLTGMGP